MKKKLTLEDFTKGEPVRYMPESALGDPTHVDTQTAVVYSLGTKYVHIKLYGILEPKVVEAQTLFKLNKTC